MGNDGGTNGSCMRDDRRDCQRSLGVGFLEDTDDRLHTAALAGVVDELAAALFLLSANGVIVHANAGGRQLLSAAKVARRASGRLVICDPAVNQRLCEFLAPAESSEVAVLQITSSDGQLWIAHLLKLAANASHAAAFALHLRPLTLDLMQPAATVGQFYHLTRAELRVLVGIVSDGGISKTARALGMSPATVKTHLQRIFEKTSTARQADLVKLVAAFASPFSGSIAASYWGAKVARLERVQDAFVRGFSHHTVCDL